MRSWGRRLFWTSLERSVFSPKPPLSQELSQWAAAVVVLAQGDNRRQEVPCLPASILDRCRQCKGLWKGVWGEPFSSRKVPHSSSLHFAEVVPPSNVSPLPPLSPRSPLGFTLVRVSRARRGRPPPTLRRWSHGLVTTLAPPPSRPPPTLRRWSHGLVTTAASWQTSPHRGRLGGGGRPGCQRTPNAYSRSA